MAKGDILNKLKISGYVTSTDPSDWIEDELDIQEGSGSSEFPVLNYDIKMVMNADRVPILSESHLTGSATVNHEGTPVTVSFEDLVDELQRVKADWDANGWPEPIGDTLVHNEHEISYDVVVYDIPEGSTLLNQLSSLYNVTVSDSDTNREIHVTQPLVRFNFEGDRHHGVNEKDSAYFTFNECTIDKKGNTPDGYASGRVPLFPYCQNPGDTELEYGYIIIDKISDLIDQHLDENDDLYLLVYNNEHGENITHPRSIKIAHPTQPLG